METPSQFYNDSIFWIEVDKISPNPFQPRKEFDQAKLNDLADKGDYDTMTKRINGGTLGIAERKTNIQKALAVLG